MWSTLAGLVVAIAALVASIVFAFNLQRMIDEPRLWGWSWDLLVGFDARTAPEDADARGWTTRTSPGPPC